MRVVTLGLVAMLALWPASSRAEDVPDMTLPEHHAEDPGAPVVTAATLFANERFWPYQVALTAALPPNDGKPALDAGAVGVLIRVETNGVARIDFGRDGLRELAIAETDLVARANRVRTGELEKIAPNFLLALGPRLVDAAGEQMLPLAYHAVATHNGFLCVFASEKQLAALAKALAPLQDRHGVSTLLFLRGELPDAKLRDRLRALAWPVPFVYDHLAEAYARTLLADDAKLPFVMLTTREGRVVYESTWKPGVAPKLIAALDEAFAGATATTADVQQVSSP